MVSKSFGPVRAVDGLTLNVRAGEIYGFLGPNGAGKTTTIKMLVGLMDPDSGSVKVGGFDIKDEPLEAKRRIGFVPDAADAYERLTGYEYLNFLADVHGVSLDHRRRRVDRLGRMFELTGALPDRIGGYSRGMKQKLIIIGALIHQPPVWILDEPMVGLDPRSAHNLKTLMDHHVARGNTVFFSTHVLEVAERLCHRIGIIRRGRLIAEGTLEELRERARSGGRQAETLENIFLELTEHE